MRPLRLSKNEKFTTCQACSRSPIQDFPYCKRHLNVYEIVSKLYTGFDGYQLLDFEDRLYYLWIYDGNSTIWYIFEQFYIDLYGPEKYIERKLGTMLYDDEMISYLLLV